MKIWVFVDYNTHPDHGNLNRHFNLGKAMAERGHEVVVFAGSHPHNTNLQLINGNEKYKVYCKTPFPWILVKTLNYEGSKAKRIASMFEFYRNAQYAIKNLDKPDIIIGSSAHPLCAVLAIKLAKKYGTKSLVEIRDLWPESIVAMGVAKKSNPIIKSLYKMEKRIYEKADGIIFTFEGGYDYIKMKKWDSSIPREKVFYINNGINIKDFDSCKNTNVVVDEDLASGKFLVIYTGSIKLANGLDRLVDCAELLKEHQDIIFLIYGDGDYRENLEKRCRSKGLTNVHFKGKIEKKYIPYILSKSSVNLLNYNADAAAAGLYRFGSSQNKLFDYLASGKPIISNTKISYDVIEQYKCGISKNLWEAKDYVQELLKIYNIPKDDYNKMCLNARRAALDFDFNKHAEKLEKISKTLQGI